MLTIAAQTANLIHIRVTFNAVTRYNPGINLTGPLILGSTKMNRVLIENDIPQLCIVL